MTAHTLRSEIIEALEEALILESSLDNFNPNRILKTAQRLSLAPFSLVEEVAHEHIFW